MRRSLLSTLLLALPIFAATGCEKFYGVHGIVHECTKDTPIESAAVTLELEFDGEIDRDEGMTDRDGTFVLVLNAPVMDLPSTLTVEKPGYAPVVRVVTERTLEQDICLERLVK